MGLDPTLISVIVLCSFLFFLMLGMPIFGALGLAAIVGILLLQGPRGLGAAPNIIYDRLRGFTLIVSRFLF